jgi:hypothetical protein
MATDTPDAANADEALSPTFVAWTVGLGLFLVFYLLFSSRLFGFLITVLCKFSMAEGSMLRVGSMSIAFLGGKILLKNIHYSSKAMSIIAADGVISMKWYHKAPIACPNPRFGTPRCRVSLSAVEVCLFNNSGKYNRFEELLLQQSAQNSKNVSVEVPVSEDAVNKPPGSTWEANIPGWYRSMGGVDLVLEGLSIMIGNAALKTMTVIHTKNSFGIFRLDRARSALDWYKNVLELTMKHPIILMVKNPDYDAKYQGAVMMGVNDDQARTHARHRVEDFFSDTLKTFGNFFKDVRFAFFSQDDISDSDADSKVGDKADGLFANRDDLQYVLKKYDIYKAKSTAETKKSDISRVLVADQMHLQYYFDTPGVFPEAVDPPVFDDESACEQGLTLNIVNAELTYGPWADHQRDTLTKFLNPWDRQDIPLYVPRPGMVRNYTRFEVLINFDDDALLVVPYRKYAAFPQLAAKIDREDELAFYRINMSGGSTIYFAMSWMTPKPEGMCYSKMVFSLHDTVIRNSLTDYRDFISTPYFRIGIDFPYPLTWNGLYEWTFSFDFGDAKFFYTSQQGNAINDLIWDWTTPEPSPFRLPEDLTHFCPTIFHYDLTFGKTTFYIPSNAYNVMDMQRFSDLDMNEYVLISVPKLQSRISQSWLTFNAQTTEMRFNASFRDMEFSLNLPLCNRHLLKMETGPFLKLQDVSLSGVYFYYNRVHHEYVDGCNIFLTLRNTSFRMMHPYVQALSYMSDNLFGASKFMISPEEFSERKCNVLYAEYLKLIDPTPHNAFEFCLSLDAFNSSADFPRGLHGGKDLSGRLQVQEVNVEMRTMPDHVDTLVSTSPVTLLFPAFSKIAGSGSRGSGELPCGQRVFLGIESVFLHTQSMYSQPPESLLYASTMMIQLGKMTGNFHPHQAKSLMDWVDAFSTVSKLPPPTVHVGLYDEKIEPSLERDKADKLITSELFAHKSVEVRCQPVNLTVADVSAVVHLTVDQGVLFRSDNLSTDRYQSKIICHVPSVSIASMIEGEFSRSQSARWLEVGRLNTGIAISHFHKDQAYLKDPKGFSTDQTSFLLACDTAHRLWYLYPESLKYGNVNVDLTNANAAASVGPRRGGPVRMPSVADTDQYRSPSVAMSINSSMAPSVASFSESEGDSMSFHTAESDVSSFAGSESQVVDVEVSPAIFLGASSGADNDNPADRSGFLGISFGEHVSGPSGSLPISAYQRHLRRYAIDVDRGVLAPVAVSRQGRIGLYSPFPDISIAESSKGSRGRTAQQKAFAADKGSSFFHVRRYYDDLLASRHNDVGNLNAVDDELDSAGDRGDFAPSVTIAESIAYGASGGYGGTRSIFMPSTQSGDDDPFSLLGKDPSSCNDLVHFDFVRSLELLITPALMDTARVYLDSVTSLYSDASSFLDHAEKSFFNRNVDPQEREHMDSPTEVRYAVPPKKDQDKPEDRAKKLLRSIRSMYAVSLQSVVIRAFQAFRHAPLQTASSSNDRLVKAPRLATSCCTICLSAQDVVGFFSFDPVRQGPAVFYESLFRCKALDLTLQELRHGSSAGADGFVPESQSHQPSASVGNALIHKPRTVDIDRLPSRLRAACDVADTAPLVSAFAFSNVFVAFSMSSDEPKAGIAGELAHSQVATVRNRFIQLVEFSIGEASLNLVDHSTLIVLSLVETWMEILTSFEAFKYRCDQRVVVGLLATIVFLQDKVDDARDLSRLEYPAKIDYLLDILQSLPERDVISLQKRVSNHVLSLGKPRAKQPVAAPLPKGTPVQKRRTSSRYPAPIAVSPGEADLEPVEGHLPVVQMVDEYIRDLKTLLMPDFSEFGELSKVDPSRSRTLSVSVDALLRDNEPVMSIHTSAQEFKFSCERFSLSIVDTAPISVMVPPNTKSNDRRRYPTADSLHAANRNIHFVDCRHLSIRGTIRGDKKVIEGDAAEFEDASLRSGSSALSGVGRPLCEQNDASLLILSLGKVRLEASPGLLYAVRHVTEASDRLQALFPQRVQDGRVGMQKDSDERYAETNTVRSPSSISIADIANSRGHRSSRATTDVHVHATVLESQILISAPDAGCVDLKLRHLCFSSHVPSVKPQRSVIDDSLLDSETAKFLFGSTVPCNSSVGLLDNTLFLSFSSVSGHFRPLSYSEDANSAMDLTVKGITMNVNAMKFDEALIVHSICVAVDSISPVVPYQLHWSESLFRARVFGEIWQITASRCLPASSRLGGSDNDASKTKDAGIDREGTEADILSDDSVIGSPRGGARVLSAAENSGLPPKCDPPIAHSWHAFVDVRQVVSEVFLVHNLIVRHKVDRIIASAAASVSNVRKIDVHVWKNVVEFQSKSEPGTKSPSKLWSPIDQARQFSSSHGAGGAAPTQDTHTFMLPQVWLSQVSDPVATSPIVKKELEVTVEYIENVVTAELLDSILTLRRSFFEEYTELLNSTLEMQEQMTDASSSEISGGTSALGGEIASSGTHSTVRLHLEGIRLTFLASCTAAVVDTGLVSMCQEVLPDGVTRWWASLDDMHAVVVDPGQIIWSPIRKDDGKFSDFSKCFVWAELATRVHACNFHDVYVHCSRSDVDVPKTFVTVNDTAVIIRPGSVGQIAFLVNHFSEAMQRFQVTLAQEETTDSEKRAMRSANEYAEGVTKQLRFRGLDGSIDEDLALRSALLVRVVNTWISVPVADTPFAYARRQTPAGVHVVVDEITAKTLGRNAPPDAHGNVGDVSALSSAEIQVRRLDKEVSRAVTQVRVDCVRMFLLEKLVDIRLRPSVNDFMRAANRAFLKTVSLEMFATSSRIRSATCMDVAVSEPEVVLDASSVPVVFDVYHDWKMPVTNSVSVAHVIDQSRRQKQELDALREAKKVSNGPSQSGSSSWLETKVEGTVRLAPGSVTVRAAGSYGKKVMKTFMKKILSEKEASDNKIASVPLPSVSVKFRSRTVADGALSSFADGLDRNLAGSSASAAQSLVSANDVPLFVLADVAFDTISIAPPVLFFVEEARMRLRQHVRLREELAVKMSADLRQHREQMAWVKANVSAVKIQKCFRGFLIRRWVRRELEKRPGSRKLGSSSNRKHSIHAATAAWRAANSLRSGSADDERDRPLSSTQTRLTKKSWTRVQDSYAMFVCIHPFALEVSSAGETVATLKLSLSENAFLSMLGVPQNIALKVLAAVGGTSTPSANAPSTSATFKGPSSKFAAPLSSARTPDANCMTYLTVFECPDRFLMEIAPNPKAYLGARLDVANIRVVVDSTVGLRRDALASSFVQCFVEEIFAYGNFDKLDDMLILFYAWKTRLAVVQDAISESSSLIEGKAVSSSRMKTDAQSRYQPDSVTPTKQRSDGYGPPARGSNHHLVENKRRIARLRKNAIPTVAYFVQVDRIRARIDCASPSLMNVREAKLLRLTLSFSDRGCVESERRRVPILVAVKFDEAAALIQGRVSGRIAVEKVGFELLRTYPVPKDPSLTLYKGLHKGSVVVTALLIDFYKGAVSPYASVAPGMVFPSAVASGTPSFSEDRLLLAAFREHSVHFRDQFFEPFDGSKSSMEVVVSSHGLDVHASGESSEELFGVAQRMGAMFREHHAQAIAIVAASAGTGSTPAFGSTSASRRLHTDEFSANISRQAQYDSERYLDVQPHGEPGSPVAEDSQGGDGAGAMDKVTKDDAASSGVRALRRFGETVQTTGSVTIYLTGANLLLFENRMTDRDHLRISMGKTRIQNACLPIPEQGLVRHHLEILLFERFVLAKESGSSTSRVLEVNVMTLQMAAQENLGVDPPSVSYSFVSKFPNTIIVTPNIPEYDFVRRVLGHLSLSSSDTLSQQSEHLADQSSINQRNMHYICKTFEMEPAISVLGDFTPRVETVLGYMGISDHKNVIPRATFEGVSLLIDSLLESFGSLSGSLDDNFDPWMSVVRQDKTLGRRRGLSSAEQIEHPST